MVWLTIYSNTVVYGDNEYGESGHLSIFTRFEALKAQIFLVKKNKQNKTYSIFDKTLSSSVFLNNFHALNGISYIERFDNRLHLAKYS